MATLSDEMRVLHALEGLFDVMLAPVRPDDLFLAPGCLIGKEEAL
jgi:hypothetical protein